MTDIFHQQGVSPVKDSESGFVQVAYDASGLLKHHKLPDAFVRQDSMSVKNVRNGKN